MKLKLLLLSMLISLTCIMTQAQPPNDTFAGAIPITIPVQGATSPQFTLPFTTDGTTDSGQDNVGCSASGNDQFFTWTATELTLTFTSLNPGSPGIAIYDAVSGTQISCSNTFVTNALQSGWALGDNLVIQIYDFNGSSADVAFDLFTIPCPAPSGLSEVEGATSADVSWTNNSTSTDTILEYGLDPLTAGTGTIINIPGGATTVNIPGLSPETDYEYILTQDCSAAGNGSSVTATGSFTTTALCPLPTSFAASNITATTLDLSWVNTSSSAISSIEYGVDGFTIGSGTVVAAGANSASITGLMPNTDYDFYVTQDCTAATNGLSVAAGPLSVETLCAAFVPDYLETFDSFVPNCWEEASDGDLTTGPTSFGSGDWGSEEFAHASTSGGGAVNVNLFNANTSDWVLSPLFDLSAGGYEVNLDVALTNYNSSAADVMGSDDEVVLAYTLDGSTWTAIQTWTAANQPATAGETFNADISTITGSTVQFGIYASEGTVDDTEDYDFHIDNFQVRTIPSCLDSNNLQLVSATQTTADITWDSNNSGTAGNFEYLLDTANSYPTGPGAMVAPTGTLTGVTGTTLPVAQAGQITGLMPSTDYDVYIREICTGTDTSPWSAALAFTTACAPITDFNEDFDSVSTPDLPSCWSFFATDIATGTDPYVRTSTSADNSAPNGVQLYSGSANGTTIPADVLLISPVLSNLNAGTHRVKFFADITVATSTVEVGTMTDPNDPTTFTALGTFSPTTTHTEYIQNFDTYAGTDTYIAFKHVFASTFDNLYLDNIVWEMIPACQAPLDITLLSATDTMATIGWTNNNGSTVSSITYGPVGFDPTMTGTTVAGGADTATITGLTGETNYDFYVTQDCSATGDGLSTQSGPLSIQTPCAAIAAPYFVDFENFSAATSGFVNDQCWNEISSGAYDWAIDNAGGTGSSNTGPSGAFSGTTFMFVEASNGSNGDVATVLSRAVDLSALTAPSVTFYYHMYGAFITDLTVAVSTDNGATFTTELTITGQQQTASADPWEQAIIDLSSYAGQTVIVAFTTSKSTMTGNTYEGDVSIDDVSFDELPTCNDVSSVTVDSVTADSITVSWTENSIPPATAWEIIAVPSGDPAPAVGTSNATSNPFVIMALTAETAYDVYVRSDCSTTFVGPITATTDCAVIVPDALETFDTFVPNCWEEASDGDLTTGPTGFGSGDWSSEEFAHNATSGGGAVNINLYRNVASDWVISPLYDLSAGGYELNLDVAVTDYNSSAAGVMGSDDQVVLVYTTDGTTWTALQTWDVSNQPATAGETYNDALTGITSATVRFAIYATDGAVDDAGIDYDFHIDNFQVRTPPSCPDTSNLTLVNNTDVAATINFDSSNATSAGNYEYSLTTVAGTAPAVSGAWTDVAGAMPNVTYTINGLTAQTEYFVHVREVCAVGDESAWSTTPINFTTDCGAVTMFPAATDFTNNVPNACWSEAGDGEIATGPTGVGASQWKDGRAYTNGVGTVVPSNVMNLYRLGDREWLISETYDLTSLTTKVLTVEVAVTDYAFSGTSTAADTGVMGSDDSVDLLITVDNGLTWTSLDAWNVGNQPAVTGDSYFYDLAAYSGTVQFAFLASDGAADDTEDYDFHVSRFVVDATAGNEDIALENSVSLYPNPVSGDMMTINLGNVPASQVSIAIFNTLGQQVMTREFDNVSNNTIVMDNLSSLTSGVYLLNISNGDSTAVKRFIKQ